ncbi:hypothetical protein LguiA_003029 [Lonicera macranthoides]
MSKLSDYIYILSTKLVSIALAMVAENRQINNVPEDLFAEEGNEMRIPQAELYLNEREELSFYEPQHRVTPPPLVRPPGRPGHNRMLGADEVTAEKRGKKKCGKSGGYGHNKTTCKGAPVVNADERIVKPRIEAEGSSTVQAGQPSRPQLLIPSMPILKANQTKNGGTKRGSTSKRGGSAKRGKNNIFKPPGPPPPPSASCI